MALVPGLSRIARNLWLDKSLRKFSGVVYRKVYTRQDFVISSAPNTRICTMPPKRKRETPLKIVEEAPKPVVSKKPRGKGRAQKEIKEDIEPVVVEAKPKRKRATYKEESSHSESEEEMPVRVVKKAKQTDRDERTAKPVRAAKKAKKVDSEDDEGEEEEEDEEEVVIEKPKKGRKKPEPAAKATPAKNKTSTSYADIDFSCTKKNALGEDWNFKISNWNVDGIRAWMKKGGLDFIEHEDPDVLCIQETKCGMDKLPSEVQEIDGYKCFWHCSSKEGYAGVGLYSKAEPVSIKYGIGDKNHDDEGRIITAEYDKFYVISVYVPNAGRGLVTLPKRLKWNQLFRDFVNVLDKKKPVIVCGDMNVAHTEIDLANPKTNTKNAGFTKEEREGMTEFLGDGYVDTYRHLYPDKIQSYTFWTYMANCRAKNVGWRLDYFIVSEKFMDSVCDNMIRSEVFGSDHCPITLFLNV